jgi:hypothetical protein
MITQLAEPVDFSLYPRYRLKVLAPASGGFITLKFENYNNTSSHEIVLTPIPGEWTDLEYNFAGVDLYDLDRMVIFPDFEGSVPGQNWYIDDILRMTPGPLELESNLPLIVINTYGIPIPDEPRIPAHMGIIDNGPGQLNNLQDAFNEYDGAITIEIRGQSTQMFPKKAYAVETVDADGEDLDVSLLGMPEESDWVLYAPYTDKSMLRNVITFDMGHRMGQYCTRTIYCEVVVNNDYKGVYVLMEKIKRGSNRVDIAKLKPEDLSGDDMTGGYIMKVDKVDWDFDWDTDGWKSNPVPAYPNAMDIIFQYYYPDPDEIPDPQRYYIKSYITMAENTLTSEQFKDPDHGYQKYFDVLSFIDFMLLNEISKEVDKYRYSTFLYKEKDSDGGKLFAGPAWDFNLGYGNVDYWPPGIDLSGFIYPMVEPNPYSIMFWWKRLMEDPYFRDMAQTRWTYLRQNNLTNSALHAVIDSITLLIDEAKDRNYERWPILGQYVWPNHDWQGNTYEDEVAYFETFLFNRLSWMDYNLPGTVRIPWAGISAEGSTLTLTLHADYFCNAMLEKEHFRVNHAPENIRITQIEYINAAQCRIIFSDDISIYPDVSVTLSEKAVNYWLDLTSNPLSTAGTVQLELSDKLHVFEENQKIHIICEIPESISGEAYIINLTGQKLETVHLDKIRENILSHSLIPGFYLFVADLFPTPVVAKFVVIR